MRVINEIIVHCSATREGKDITVHDIDSWHKQRGFRCIGYHYVIYLDGSVHIGRPENEEGAHCLGHNKTSIGICYIGGLDIYGKPKDTRTDEQKKSPTELIRTLKTRFPQASIHGHNEFANKACPCFDVRKEFNQ